MRALFLGAHPDDVEVSAGGTVARLVDEGWDTTLAIPLPDDERTGEFTMAATVLGSAHDYLASWSAWRIRTVMTYRILDGPYDLIVTPSPTDSHQEHRQVAELGIALARKNNTDLWHMNQAILGGLANPPHLNHYVTFNQGQWERKEQALRAHDSQYQKYGPNWLDSIFFRDSYLGRSVGATYAEGFEIAFSRQ